MIDLKVTTLGGAEIAKTLAFVEGEIQASLRDELADIGMLTVKGLSRPLAVSNVLGLKGGDQKVVWLGRQTH